MEKNNHLKKNTRQSTATLTTKKCRENQKFISFGQIMQHLLSSALQFKYKCQYEGANWKSIHLKYEKINEESKDFLNLKNCATVLASSLSMLPPLSRTFFALIWYCVQISKIVKKIILLQISFHYVPLRRA